LRRARPSSAGNALANSSDPEGRRGNPWLWATRYGWAGRRGRFGAYDAGMPRYLHTMYRITDPERSRAFYEALGFEFRREMDIVRDGRVEATNYFFGTPGQDEELELTFNHDGRSYEPGTAYGHIALGVEDLDATLARLREQGIEPEREPYRVREGGSRLCFVQDPDGNNVEAVFHGDH
jgi:lactoylglutathione lyase